MRGIKVIVGVSFEVFVEAVAHFLLPRLGRIMIWLLFDEIATLEEKLVRTLRENRLVFGTQG